VTENDDDFLFPKAKEQKAQAQSDALVFAQKYLVFAGPTSEPRARSLFEHWTRLVRNQAIPPGASAQEYAYYNARREFVEAIAAQIEFANNGVNQPQPRTK
jgi:hypothetical protein